METPNLNYINNLAGDDIEFKNKFIDILKVEFPIEKLEYLDNIENSKTNAAYQNVHKIKHKITILGLNESHAIAVRHEEELREGKTDMQFQFKTILNVMENYIKAI